MTEHTHKQFDAEMELIRSGVLAMGGLVETQLTRALAALADEETADLDRRRRRRRAGGQPDADGDRPAVHADHRQAPAGGDRPADDHDGHQGRQRSRADRRRGEEGRVQGRAGGRQRAARAAPHTTTSTRALVTVRSMLQAALDAFARLDTEAAAKVVGDDQTVDASFHAIMRQLISYMMEDPRTISTALEILFIAKSIERVGDHAKNIAEAVVQAVQGRGRPARVRRPDPRGDPAAMIRRGRRKGEYRSAQREGTHDADDHGRRGRARDHGAPAGQPRRRRLRRARGRRRRDGAADAERIDCPT